MNKLHIRELAALIGKFSEEDGIHETAIPGVTCIRLSEPNTRLPNVYTPSLCVIVQGRKQVLLESEVYEYRPSEYLAISVDLPVIGVVTEASRGKPYLCLQIALDQHQLAELQVAACRPVDRKVSAVRGIFIGNMESALSDCVLRLARLLDAPQEIAPLAPMIKREIHYRLLHGEHGAMIAQLAQSGSHMQRIAAAVSQIKANYDKPIRVEMLAEQIGMSVSSFHAHFKAVTAMSPLQYQKRLRLMEARKIMLAERQDAASAAYRVGYESPSQFSREYARLFGNPPGRDVQQLLLSASP